MKINPEIVGYVEQNVIPKYVEFDKAHREDHVRMVIEQSLRLAGRMPEANPEMVYVVAAFHDLGLVNGRETHHIDSRKILESNIFIKAHFSEEEIRLMGESVEDHRASSQHAPRSIYGMIVAEADRFIDPETIIRRTVQYGLSHYPELDEEGHYRRTIQHLSAKYGPGGYLRIWIPWSDNAERLERLREITADEERIRAMFTRIFNEESECGS